MANIFFVSVLLAIVSLSKQWDDHNITGYHFHTYFFQNNNESTQEALIFRYVLIVTIFLIINYNWIKQKTNSARNWCWSSNRLSFKSCKLRATRTTYNWQLRDLLQCFRLVPWSFMVHAKSWKFIDTPSSINQMGNNWSHGKSHVFGQISAFRFKCIELGYWASWKMLADTWC